MLTFDQFPIAPGWCLDGHVRRGCVTFVPLHAALLPDGFIEQFLVQPLRPSSDGQIKLAEVLDSQGNPQALHQLSPDRVQAFFARFVGFVLSDGGLIDTLTVRENLLLPALYHDVQWGSTRAVEAQLTAELEALIPLADQPAAQAELNCYPSELPSWRRRYWGWIRTLARTPQLVIAFSPLADLPDEARTCLTTLLARYRIRQPQAAHLYFLIEPHEGDALAGPTATVLSLQPAPAHVVL